MPNPNLLERSFEVRGCWAELKANEAEQGGRNFHVSYTQWPQGNTIPQPPVARQLALGSSRHLQSYPARPDACFWEHEPAVVADTIGPLVGGQIVGDVLASDGGYCGC